MTDADLTPERFGAAFKAFMEAMLAGAAPPSNTLLDRLAAHLGTDPTLLPVVTEEFDRFEHPNVQAAFDDHVGRPGRGVTLLGIAAEHKRFMSLSLSDIVSPPSGPGRPPLSEGPIDYVNFHLAGDRVLPCVQFGLYLIADGEQRLVALVTGPFEHAGPRPKLRVEVMSAQPDDGRRFLTDLKELLRTATLLAAVEGDATLVSGAHLDAALAKLREGGQLTQRILGFRSAHGIDDPDDPTPPSRSRGEARRGVWAGG